MNEREWMTKAVLCGLLSFGLVQMMLNPLKTYNLLVHKVGWHDMG